MPDDEHRGMAIWRDGPRVSGYRARCSCGWDDPIHCATQDEARQRWAEHRRAVDGRPTPPPAWDGPDGDDYPDQTDDEADRLADAHERWLEREH